MRHVVDLKAEVAASRVAAVTAPFEAAVRRVAVREGQSVNAGDVLVELTNPELDRNVEIARAQREYAEARLHAAARPIEHKSADAAMRRIVALKKAKLDRYRTLLATHDATLQEVEDAENEYAAAQRDLINIENSAPAAPQTRVAEIELERARADERLAESRRQTLVVRARTSREYRVTCKRRIVQHRAPTEPHPPRSRASLLRGSSPLRRRHRISLSVRGHRRRRHVRGRQHHAAAVRLRMTVSPREYSSMYRTRRIAQDRVPAELHDLRSRASLLRGSSPHHQGHGTTFSALRHRPAVHA